LVFLISGPESLVVGEGRQSSWNPSPPIAFSSSLSEMFEIRVDHVQAVGWGGFLLVYVWLFHGEKCAHVFVHILCMGLFMFLVCFW
jgi:hypothetical protein